MKKFMFLYYGFGEPTKENKEAWSKWFASVGDKFIDSGNPFGAGREITPDNTRALSHEDKEAITGYSIINAKDLDEAEKIAKTCPIITGLRVYEAMTM